MADILLYRYPLPKNSNIHPPDLAVDRASIGLPLKMNMTAHQGAGEDPDLATDREIATDLDIVTDLDVAIDPDPDPMIDPDLVTDPDLVIDLGLMVTIAKTGLLHHQNPILRRGSNMKRK